MRQPTDIFCLLTLYHWVIEYLLDSMETSHTHWTILIEVEQCLKEGFEFFKVRYGI